MRVSLLRKDILAHKSDALLIVAASQKGKMVFPASLRALDRQLDGLLSAVVKRARFAAAGGEILALHAPPAAAYGRIVLVGRGVGDTAAIAQAVAALGDVESLTVWGADSAAVAAVGAGAYRYRLGAAWPVTPGLKRVHWAATGLPAKTLARWAAVGEGMRLARHLAEQPGNICTPDFLAQTARRMGRRDGLKVKILERRQMRTLGMGGLLAVAQGSARPPKLIILQHRGAAGAPVVLVGKGVTFDTGGISLKPAAAMDEMKFDMGGAASVFGVLLACARMQLPLHVVGIIPACENMPGDKAVKPGDVITAMNGKTIEVLNTDAEGRLILADALAYSGKYKPAAVVDVATLTGACVIALGHHFSGLMSSSDSLAAELLSAGDSTGDGCWRLPLGAPYSALLKSDYADLANIGGRSGGTITAACFLSHFVAGKEWAHLDVAGTAWTPKKRATGRPVALLGGFLMRRAGVMST